MGAPFWAADGDMPNNHYEPFDLSCVLRTMWNEWNEANAVSRVTDVGRSRILRNWIVGRESASPDCSHFGAKHPLISLSLNDIVEAWGSETRFIWAYRDLRVSIQGLIEVPWTPGPEKSRREQVRLWTACEMFFHPGRPNTLQLGHDEVRRDPAMAVDCLIAFIEAAVNEEKRQSAIDDIILA